MLEPKLKVQSLEVIAVTPGWIDPKFVTPSPLGQLAAENVVWVRTVAVTVVVAEDAALEPGGPLATAHATHAASSASGSGRRAMRRIDGTSTIEQFRLSAPCGSRGEKATRLAALT